MGSVSVCREAVGCVSHRQVQKTLTSSNSRYGIVNSSSLPFVCSLKPSPRQVDCFFRSSIFVSDVNRLRLESFRTDGFLSRRSKRGVGVACAKGARNDTPRPEYSSDAKIRSEVIAPFRSFRMFFYGAFIASASIGGVIATTRLIASLNHAPGAEPAIEIAKGLAIDLGAVLIFALLYRSDSKARDISLAKISREENLSNLRIQLSNNKVVNLGQLRGTSRIVILAGPGSYIEEALRASDAFREELLERGVMVAPYATDGAPVEGDSSAATSSSSTTGRLEGASDTGPTVAVAVTDLQRKWRATPIYTAEWGRWINEQKKLANVSPDKPVYISLRLDGRVRGSGVGIPPWRAMSLQLPPLKGIWGGALDGMDGRV